MKGCKHIWIYKGYENPKYHYWCKKCGCFKTSVFDYYKGDYVSMYEHPTKDNK